MTASKSYAQGIGEQLVLHIDRAGVSQEELVRCACVTEAAVSRYRYIKGDREPHAITIGALAKGLGIIVNDLIGAESGTMDDAYEMLARNAKACRPRDAGKPASARPKRGLRKKAIVN